MPGVGIKHVDPDEDPLPRPFRWRDAPLPILAIVCMAIVLTWPRAWDLAKVALQYLH